MREVLPAGCHARVGKGARLQPAGIAQAAQCASLLDGAGKQAHARLFRTRCIFGPARSVFGSAFINGWVSSDPPARGSA